MDLHVEIYYNNSFGGLHCEELIFPKRSNTWANRKRLDKVITLVHPQSIRVFLYRFDPLYKGYLDDILNACQLEEIKCLVFFIA